MHFGVAVCGYLLKTENNLNVYANYLLTADVLLSMYDPKQIQRYNTY